jgi:hypothetical protein
LKADVPSSVKDDEEAVADGSGELRRAAGAAVEEVDYGGGDAPRRN